MISQSDTEEIERYIADLDLGIIEGWELACVFSQSHDAHKLLVVATMINALMQRRQETMEQFEALKDAVPTQASQSLH
jgi:hypothetical protein